MRTSFTVMVHGVADWATTDDVWRWFSDFGHVRSVRRVKPHPDGSPKSYLFVEMGSVGDAAAALRLDGQVRGGRRLTVQPATERQPKRGERQPAAAVDA